MSSQNKTDGYQTGPFKNKKQPALKTEKEIVGHILRTNFRWLPIYINFAVLNHVGFLGLGHLLYLDWKFKKRLGENK